MNILVGGDWNARLGTEQILTDSLNSRNEHLKIDRNAEDNIINSRGRKMLEFCQDNNLIILNGCTKSDPTGQLTFVGGQGTSTNDYCAASGNWLEYLRDFEILRRTFSDHMPIVTHVGLRLATPAEDLKLLPKLQWHQRHKALFQRNLEQLINQQNFSMLDINEYMVSITDCIYKADPLPREKYKHKGKHKWFDSACLVARNKSFAYLNLFRDTKQDELKELYSRANTSYKTLCRMKKQEHMRATAEALSKSKSSREFWKYIKVINETNFKIGCNLSASALATHYHNLLSNETMTKMFHYAANFVEDDLTNGEIRLEELRYALTTAKENKAAGHDRIPYEHLKNCTNSFQLRLLELFNKIWNEESVPKNFKSSIIFPIFKGGDVNSPINYRGISFLNTTSKLFSSIILRRLEKFVAHHDILSEYQAGFRKGYSTVDHLFTLFNAVETSFTKGKKLYAAFVDFRAAFDTVNRSALIYKLANLQISTKMVRIIQLLYTNTKAAVWNGQNLSEWFQTQNGVLQGCVLSPLLFALYINDLPDHLPGGIKIKHLTVKLLLYADDLVLLSDTPQTLQNMLNHLYEYCNMWDLKINLNKTKIIVFNKRAGRRAESEKWHLNGDPIEIVNKYKYLGIALTPQLNMKHHLRAKLADSIKALNTSWSNIMKNTSISLNAKYKVFTSSVRSIMCYGAQVWGNYPYDEVEKLLRYFVKKLFYLPQNTPNYMVLLETGLAPLAVYTLKLHTDYVLRSLSYNDTRIPCIVSKGAIESNTGWHRRIRELAEVTNTPVNFNSNLSDIKKQLQNIVEGYAFLLKNQSINQARSSTSRLLYPQLNYNLDHTTYFVETLSRLQISAIFKARGDLLDLNYTPYKAGNSLECDLCNMRAREDGFHFLAVCPLLKEFRLDCFGKRTLTMNDLVEILNGTKWSNLAEYCLKAFQYRRDNS